MCISRSTRDMGAYAIVIGFGNLLLLKRAYLFLYLDLLTTLTYSIQAMSCLTARERRNWLSLAVWLAVGFTCAQDLAKTPKQTTEKSRNCGDIQNIVTDLVVYVVELY